MKKFTVKTKKMVFGGSCIAEIDKKTVFIPYSIPDEILEISIVKDKKHYFQGNIDKIVKPSPHRIMPKCPHFYKCGGCNLQMIEDNYQKYLRQYMATEALKRANPNVELNTNFIEGSFWEYRSRFQFHIEKNGNFAQKMENSNELVTINQCPVALKGIQSLLNGKFAFDKKSDGIQANERFHIFCNKENKIFTRKNANSCYANICNRFIKFNPLGFFQSNLKMTEKLVETIFKNFTPTERVLDFYSGVGTISIFATEYVKEIHLVEHNKYSNRYAKINFSKDNQVILKKTKIFYHTINGENWIKQKESKLNYGAVFIDPPRNGIDKLTLSWLCNKKIPVIYYISCDPVTFARDVNKILKSGYFLENHFLFDFYPQTHHIETLAILKYI